MDIEARRQRLDNSAELAGREGVHWYGEDHEKCGRCGVEVPSGYQLALPQSDICGCLRCLEYQAHLAIASAERVPLDLIGTVNQQDALRQVGEQFRAHIKAIERGRPPPMSRKMARERWASRIDPDGFDAPARDDDANRPSRWPAKSSPLRRERLPDDGFDEPKFNASTQPAPPRSSSLSRHAENLGLTEARSREQIISAFRQSALICHPDYGGSAEAFQRIMEARDALLASLEASPTRPYSSKPP